MSEPKLTKFTLTKKLLALWYWQDVADQANANAQTARAQLSEKEFWSL